VSQYNTRLAYALSEAARKFKNGVFQKNLARVVTRSNHQESLFENNKSYSPVYEYPCLLAIATISDLDVIQFDVTPACRHSTYKEENHIGQPDRYADPRKRNWVWHLFASW